MGPLDDLLHEYEPDLISSGDARLRKIFELRQAIQDGKVGVVILAGGMATRFGADKIPHTVIIDKKGVVRSEHTGLKESNDDFLDALNTQIEKLLQEDSRQ